MFQYGLILLAIIIFIISCRLTNSTDYDLRLTHIILITLMIFCLCTILMYSSFNNPDIEDSE